MNAPIAATQFEPMRDPAASRARMQALLAERRPYFSLPQPFYNDPEVFRMDLEAIFHKRWIFAGAECEIPNAGDYFTLAIGPTPLVVLRDQDGAIRAFFNTCRHRGSKICLADKGAVRRLVCPYHQWTYDLSGRLDASGRMHDDFDRGEYSLRPVHARAAGGTIYICLADEPPDFDAYGASIEPFLAPHDLPDAKVAHRTQVIVKGNWKLVMENSRECFHCPARHHELMNFFLHDYNFEEPGNDDVVSQFWQRCAALGLVSEAREGDDFRVVRLPLKKGALSSTMDGSSAVSRLLGTMPTADAGSVRWCISPARSTTHSPTTRSSSGCCRSVRRKPRSRRSGWCTAMPKRGATTTCSTCCMCGRRRTTRTRCWSSVTRKA